MSEIADISKLTIDVLRLILNLLSLRTYYPAS